MVEVTEKKMAGPRIKDHGTETLFQICVIGTLVRVMRRETPFLRRHAITQRNKNLVQTLQLPRPY